MASSPLRKINGQEFACRLKASLEQPDTGYAFFLGAGCSISSGIPAAGTLVRQVWLPTLKRLRDFANSDFDTWAKSEYPDYDPANPAALYGQIMGDLFFQPEERQREIERLCDHRSPGFGYAVLAALVAQHQGHFNVVLTTNFDDLVADALYLFTNARPLVIQHEALATYIRASRTRPLVVKLHGDLRITPQNADPETNKLKVEIDKQVRGLLQDRGLVFIGYGGHDNGITEMLADLPQNALPLGVYWVSGKLPEGDMAKWLKDREACWVELQDFDELMQLIRDSMELPISKSLDRFQHIGANTATATTLNVNYSNRPGQTCFISYARADDDFATKLHDDLEISGIDCWKDTEDMRGGKPYRKQIREAIEKYDRVLLVCSKQSLERTAVIEEIVQAKKLEELHGSNKLFPIRIDDYILSEKLQSIATQKTETGDWEENWLTKVKAYHISDFSGWQNDKTYQKSFNHLLRDLKEIPDQQ